MKPHSQPSKCLHCNDLFTPDYRNRERQKYCDKPDCRRASKRATQQRWLQKPENQNYFRDEQNVQRVRERRAAHPGYWKRSAKKAAPALQAPCPAKPLAPEAVKISLPERPLQDLWISQHPLVVGLVAQITASTLPEDIDQTIRCLISKGRDILEQPSRTLTKGYFIYDDRKKTPAPRAPAASPAPVQLDRPSVDPPPTPARL